MSLAKEVKLPTVVTFEEEDQSIKKILEDMYDKIHKLQNKITKLVQNIKSSSARNRINSKKFKIKEYDATISGSMSSKSE